MIIGKNTNLQPKNSFIKSSEGNPLSDSERMMQNNRVMQHTNVMSKDEMNDRAFAMLQDRLNKGLINMDEFNKMCNQLGKRK